MKNIFTYKMEDFSFKIIGYDVIIDKIMIKMDVKDIINLCASAKWFYQFYKQHYNRIWTMLLKRDYSQFGMRGDLKQHYIKIFSGIGSAYVVTYNPFDLKTNKNEINFFDIEDELIYAGDMDPSTTRKGHDEDSEQINILGNQLEVPTKKWVLFHWIYRNNKNFVFENLHDALTKVTEQIYYDGMAYLSQTMADYWDDTEEEWDEEDPVEIEQRAAHFQEKIKIQPFTKQNIYNFMKENLFFNSLYGYDGTWWQLKEFTFDPPDIIKKHFGFEYVKTDKSIDQLEYIKQFKLTDIQYGNKIIEFEFLRHLLRCGQKYIGFCEIDTIDLEKHKFFYGSTKKEILLDAKLWFTKMTNKYVKKMRYSCEIHHDELEFRYNTLNKWNETIKILDYNMCIKIQPGETWQFFCIKMYDHFGLNV